MQRSTLTKIAGTAILTIIFFSILTQRMMITTETDGKESLRQWIESFENRSTAILLMKSGVIVQHSLNAIDPNSHKVNLTNSNIVSNSNSPLVVTKSIDTQHKEVQNKVKKLTSESKKLIKKVDPSGPNIKFKSDTNTIAYELPSSTTNRGTNTATSTSTVTHTVPLTTTEKVGTITITNSNSKKARKEKTKTKAERDMENDLILRDHHPNYSPRNGTDISPEHQMSVLLCINQSRCVVPELQLQIKFKIYLCKKPSRAGVRFYFLVREGLLLHPNVELVEEKDINSADYIVYLPGSAPWHLTECTNPNYKDRMIVLDEFDGHSPLFTPTMPFPDLLKHFGKDIIWYFLYFKRSFVKRKDGVFVSYPHINKQDVYPITYSIAEAYLPMQFNFIREIEIMCSLRGSKHMTTRLRAQQWVAEYGEVNKIKNIISGQVNTATRTTVSTHYFEHMFNSKIIVTVNPANWEGDFRLWESLCTGALVFVDRLFVPHSYPLVHGKHVIYYSNTNKTDLFTKLDYYRKNVEEAKQIAINGYLYAMKYHRTVNMIDYVLRSAHYKQALISNKKLPSYLYTAQSLNQDILARKEEFAEIIRKGKQELKSLESIEAKEAVSVGDLPPVVDMIAGSAIKFGK